MSHPEFMTFSILMTMVVVGAFLWMFFNMAMLFVNKQVQEDDAYGVRMSQMMACIRPPMAMMTTLGIAGIAYFIVRNGLPF